MVKIVKFKKVPFAELMKLTDLCPATFNQHSMEISYRNEPCVLKQEHEDIYGSIFNEEDHRDDPTLVPNSRSLYQ
jgi:hypothetical protein